MKPIISKIGIQNFKAFGKYTELEISDVTIVSGLNSSGKSSIYQALFALAQSYGNYIGGKSAEGHFWRIPYLTLNGDLLDLGIPNELLNDSDDNEISIKLFWDDNTKTSMSFRLMTKRGYEKKKTFLISNSLFEDCDGFYCSAHLIEEAWNVCGYGAINFVNTDIANCIIQFIENGIKIINKEEILEGDRFYFKKEVIFEKVVSLEFNGFFVDSFAIEIEDVLSCVEEKFLKFVDEEKLKNEIRIHNDNKDLIILSNSLRRTFQKYNFETSDITYLPPFRGFPKRVYSFSDTHRLDVERFHSPDRIPYYFDAEKGVAIMGTLKEAVNYWIVEHFCLADEVILEEPIPELASEMFLRFGDKRVPINNVGFGTSQIIPVIYEILSNISSMLCFVDEPEIHLHPSAQSKLADFFFQMGLLGKKVFVETHSEYLIDKAIFLKLKSQQLSPQMKMVWVKKDSNDSFIEEIIHDNLGFIINAPEGFLSEKNNLSAQMSEMRFKSI